MTTATRGINLKGIDVLVVEDDAASALLLSHALSSQGARVDTAGNGSEALARF